MLAQIKGKLIYQNKTQAIIDTGSLAFEVILLNKDISKLKLNDPVTIWIYTHISEASVKLFGFLDFKERELFELFIDISGVGPKIAMNIINRYEISQIIEAVNLKEASFFQEVSGVGAKNAQRIIIELQGKLGPGGKTSSSLVHSSLNELEEALKKLGYKRSEIAHAIANIPTDEELPQQLKIALSKLSSL